MKDKVLLITGGTGSFGNAVLKRILKTDIKEIRIFSRDEKKQDDMRQNIKDERVKFYIGDVRDKESIEYVMSEVNYVFHAAALKQVPSCEFFPMQAIKTNVIGAENVLNVAIENKVEKVIVLSTDKAVYPINVMGMSKAIMEKIMIAKSRQKNHSTIMCGTRYGNVMASRGSVIPLFIDKILKKEDITVTDPNMTRFMMDIDEAVDLVLYAFKNGRSGDIFIQKSPASTIEILAKALKKIFNSDSDIRVIGTRHGEKLYETLVNREEMTVAEDLDRYYRIPADFRDLNYKKYFTKGEDKITESSEYTSHNTTRLDLDGTVELLNSLEIVKETLKKLKGE